MPEEPTSVHVSYRGGSLDQTTTEADQLLLGGKITWGCADGGQGVAQIVEAPVTLQDFRSSVNEAKPNLLVRNLCQSESDQHSGKRLSIPAEQSQCDISRAS